MNDIAGRELTRLVSHLLVEVLAALDQALVEEGTRGRTIEACGHSFATGLIRPYFLLTGVKPHTKYEPTEGDPLAGNPFAQFVRDMERVVTLGIRRALRLHETDLTDAQRSKGASAYKIPDLKAAVYSAVTEARPDWLMLKNLRLKN